MELSPEERRRIYEEEKARIEAREQIEREKRQNIESTSTGLQPNVAGLLCYVGGWISGIIFFILEQKNAWVRFHAAQSIVVFGVLTVAGVILGWLPLLGEAFKAVVLIITFILWIILMLKAYNGERYKLAWAGDMAEKIVDSTGMSKPEQPTPVSAEPGKEDTPVAATDTGGKVDDTQRYVTGWREARIAESAFAIAGSIVLLIFFNYFHEYVAYYQQDIVGNVTVWTRTPFFTAEVYLWLPILTLTLVLSIIGHIALIIYDKYLLREILRIVMDIFGVITVITLITIFPFNFNVIPNTTLAGAVPVGLTIGLVVIAVGIGIGILVRTIKLVVNLARGITDYK
jgi:uncharacterized membrane protein